MPEPLPDEDDELELEPIDPEILDHQRQRGRQKTDQAQAAVDADLIRQAEELGDPVSLEDLKKFRFTTRHLMTLTALLALVMAFCQWLGAGLGLFVSAVIAVSSGWFFTMRREQHQRHAVDQLRQELATQQADRTRSEGEQPDTKSETGAKNGPFENDDPLARTTKRPELNFSFSLKEMFITFIVAALLLGLVRLFGPGPLAMFFGMIALAGLIAQAVGVETPPIAVFGWWILLVLYILLGLWSSTTSKEESVSSRQGAVTTQEKHSTVSLPPAGLQELADSIPRAYVMCNAMSHPPHFHAQNETGDEMWRIAASRPATQPEQTPFRHG